MGTKILVTGASGYLGSNLTKRLVAQGHNVRAFVRRNSPNIKNLEGIEAEIFWGDLTEEKSVKEAMKGIDVVFHIGALYRQANVPKKAYYDVNFMGTKRVLEAAMREKVSKFIHCSTVGVLGGPKILPADEQSPYNPGDDYQISKMEGERLVLEAYEKHGFPITVVRPAAIYGPGDMRMLKMFRMIARKRFVMLGDGNPYLHLVYIDDLVDGFLLAWEKPNSVGQVYIIGGPEYVTLNKLAAIIADEFKVPRPRLHLPLRPFQLLGTAVEKVCAPLGIEPPIYRRRVDFFAKSRAFDISKARRELGYEPKIDIKTGVHLTAQWYVENGFI